jgi:hypothetical protein
MVEKNGADATTMRSVLEFGCGSARVLRHFRYIEGLRLAGTDANQFRILRGVAITVIFHCLSLFSL